MTGSYPEALIFVVLIFGGLLSLGRPYWAFLLASFGLSALNLTQAFFTRTFLGPYFNLVDAFIIVMLIALAMKAVLSRPRRLFIPRPLGWLVIPWIAGTVLGILALGGLRYEVAREAKWALSLPISILVAANFVTDKRRCSQFAWVLFAGGVVAAAQHIFLVRSEDWEALGSLVTAAILNNIRDIGFLFSPISYYFVAATNRPAFIEQDRSRLIKIAWWGGVILFLVSIILNQTRSHWIAIAASVAIIALLVKEARQMFKTTTVLALLFLVLLVVSPMLIPALDPVDILISRSESVIDEVLRYQTTLTRRTAIQVETRAWLEGGPVSWLFGRGFAYRWADEWRIPYGETSSEGVAWGHVGYIRYLANLGLLGLFVYGILIPLFGLRLGRHLFLHSFDPAVRMVALLVLASVSVNSVNFIMSGSYLQPEMIVPGLLLGAGTGVAQTMVSVSNHQTRESRTWRPGRVSPW